MAKAGIRNRRAFEKDLDRFVDAEDFATEFIASRYAFEIILKLIQQTEIGRGPDGKRFKKYSEAYRKRKAKAIGIRGNWMRGAPGSKDKGPDTAHMLDESNFRWEFRAPGDLVLIWDNAAMEVYANAHQEGKGDMPKREWMTLLATKTVKKIEEDLVKLSRRRIVKFSVKWA